MEKLMEKLMFHVKINLSYLLIASVLLLNSEPLKYMSILFIFIFIIEVVQGVINHDSYFRE